MAWLRQRGSSSGARLAGRAARSRRVLIPLIVAFLLATGVASARFVLPLHAQVQVSAATAFHGADTNKVQQAVNAEKLQAKANWCGIAAIAWVAYYHGNHTITQQQVDDYLNSPDAVSPWGTPSKDPFSGGPGVKADISRDSGTDPRAHVVGLEYATQSPYSQFIGLNGARDATNHLIADVVQSSEPIAVIVDHGLHTVLVSGVYATGDPISNPGSVTSLLVWDPGNPSSASNIQSTTKATISISTWLSNSIYWGKSYASNPILGGKIVLDPDPAVSPYTYNTSTSMNDFVHLWIGRYVYMRPKGTEMDWAYDGSENLIKGWHGEVPSDYTGPTTTLANKITLSDSSIDAPGFWSRDTDASSSTGPAAVLAWSGTDASHHLNVMTSSDGFRYGSKITLSDTSPHGPAVTVVQDSGKSVVAIAWMGGNASHSLNVMYDIYHVVNPRPLKITLPISCAYAPTLTVFGGQLWLGWTGTDARHTVNVLAMGPTGQTPGTPVPLTGTSSSASPTLATDATNNQLLLAWQDRSTSLLNLAQSTDGATWTTEPATTQSSSAAPYLTAITTPPDGMLPYQWIWTKKASHTIYIMQGGMLTDWQPAVVLRESSPFGPTIGYVGQPHEVMLAWTGTDGAHHLNVASYPV
jgi:hypothetical protein